MHQRRKPSKRKRKKTTSKNKIAYGIIAVALIFVGLFAFSSLYSNKPSSHDQTAPPKAALVDHLGLSFLTPNETFKKSCIKILEEAGFSVTYHRGEAVTVDFYRNLPTHGYSLLVLRVHSAAIKHEIYTDLVGLFTCETYTESKYRTPVDELADARLAKAFFTGGNNYYFGVTSRFVQFSMNGEFENTVVLMMGCDGLKEGYTSMAEAFVNRGAKVYISWDGPVSISHSDQATIQLLQSLLKENKTIKNAVAEISPDLTYSPPNPPTNLCFYPDPQAGDYVIPSFSSSLTTNVTEILPIFDKLRRSRAKLFHGS